MGHHTAIAWQYGVHVELFHTSQNLLLKLLLTGIPRERQRSTPPFEVVHLPPGEESRTSDKIAHLFLRIAQLEQHVTPDALLTDDGQREVHTMKCHPVDFLLPALPAPERHRVAEGTVIEVIAQGEIGLVALLLRDCGEHSGQLGLHLVPSEMDAGIVLQVPVHTRGDVHPGVSSHHDLLTSLI